MNKSLKKILLGTGFAAVSLATLSSASWSMNHGSGMGMGHDPGRMLAHMVEQLELSAEQQQEVENLLTTTQQTTVADRQRLRTLRAELRQQGADFDSGQVQATADEIGQITARLVYQAASTQAKVQAVLTPEQREEMARLMEKRNDRRGKWHRGGDQSRRE